MIENEYTFTFIMETYADLVTRIGIVSMGNRQDAKDIFQNVFLKLYECKIEFHEEEHIKAWLINTTHRACIDETRKFWRRHRVDYDDAFFGVEDKTDYAMLCYLMMLPDKNRKALYLHYYEGYQVQEIAMLLHAKENTVKSWIKRGKAQLRSLIGGEEHA